MHDVAVALRSYLTPMLAARPLKVAFLVLLVFLALVGLAFLAASYGFLITRETLGGARIFAIAPGVALAAILLGELPLRDAIRERTLLYPLLGPCPRPVLAATRTLVTGLLLGLGAVITVAVVRVMEGEGVGRFPLEALGCLLGSLAYVAIFGLIHLMTSRGLIGGLAYLLFLDEAVGRIPFALRNAAPSYHLRVLADQVVDYPLPISVLVPEPSVGVSAAVLIVIAAGVTALTAWLFSRRNLGELC